MSTKEDKNILIFLKITLDFTSDIPHTGFVDGR